MKWTILFMTILSACTSKPFKPTSWGIQLQGYEGNQSLTKIKDSKADLWVMDYMVDGKELTSTQVGILRNRHKKMISYMSIGEAEEYRFYYPTMPKDLVGPSNPDFPNNFTVNYWDPRWQEIFLSRKDGYLKRIMDAGFNGVFMDIIDAFERFPDKDQKAEQMADFIIRISEEAKARDKNFIIILQNGLHIRRHLKNPKRLLPAIDGVNAESGFFYGNKDIDNPYSVNLSLLEDVKFYQDHGKFVLSLEYLRSATLIDQYFSFSKIHGLIPVAAERNLKGHFISP